MKATVVFATCALIFTAVLWYHIGKEDADHWYARHSIAMSPTTSDSSVLCSSVSATVYRVEKGHSPVLAQLYADKYRAIPMMNPMRPDNNCQFQFFTEEGEYIIEMEGNKP
jgi:hypothetical protein